MFDIANLMGKVKEMQAKLQEAQENLVHLKASAEAGAGMVKATVNGKKMLVSMEIDKDLLRPEDKDMLQDLVVAAVNKAIQEVDAIAQEELRKQTQDILPNLPNIPGLDLNKMG
jgi:DNA-binding YbaB/EbfC family protein